MIHNLGLKALPHKVLTSCSSLSTPSTHHARSMLQTLPTEIFLLIMDELEAADVRSVVLVCRDFRLRAQKLLFKFITLVLTGNASDINKLRFLSMPWIKDGVLRCNISITEWAKDGVFRDIGKDDNLTYCHRIQK